MPGGRLGGREETSVLRLDAVSMVTAFMEGNHIRGLTSIFKMKTLKRLE